MPRIPAKILATVSFAFLISVIFGLSPVRADEVGRVGVDWIGNDIIIEAIEDPKVDGITCHIAYFERSILDRLQQGNWFEDPSNASIDCTATGPITIGDIDLGRNGEEVFNERRSIIIKTLAVNRIYDAANDTLIYLVHSREFQQGSAKMSIGAVPLGPLDVTWGNGRPGE
jgi:CreA protein